MRPEPVAAPLPPEQATGGAPQPDPALPARQTLATLAGYILLSLVVTWPMLLHFTTQEMGEDYFDRVQNTWNLWWVKVALLDRHASPFVTNLLFYPQGTDLYYHTLNLPSTLITLGPLLALGVTAAYNTSVLVALTLSGYAGFRLVYYLTGHRAAAFLGGVIIGYNSLSLVVSRGQINIASIQWLVLSIEFYLRAWEGGRRRDALLLGVFVTLAVLTVGYYEVYLLVFFALHFFWSLAIGPGDSRGARLRDVLRRAGRVLVWGGGTTVVLAGPYALAAANSLLTGRVKPQAEPGVALNNAADLLSFVVPNRAHWLLGSALPWWQSLNPAIHDYTYLGVVPLVLAALAVWAGRRRASTWLWVGVAVVGVALALGPVLEINGARTVGGTEVPMLLGLLQAVPPFSLVRAPERFVTLTYIALGVLAGMGIANCGLRIADWLRGMAHTAFHIPQWVLGAGILGLLLLEMPLHVRATEPLTVPPSLSAVASDSAPGALLELPLTQHGWRDTPRMLGQTSHARPILGGYLSRPIVDPYTQACSPFQVFGTDPLRIAQDVVSPTALSQLSPTLLAANGIGFLAVYKQGYVNSNMLEPLPDTQLAALQNVAALLGTPLADDAQVTTYRARPAAGLLGLYLQLGPDWYNLEQSNGQPFRWMKGQQADLCVISPAAQTTPLAFQVASFAVARHLQVWIGGRQVYAATVPAGFALQPFQTPPLAWPAGPQLVRLVVPEAGVVPANLGQGVDPRVLGLGFSAIHLAEGTP